MCHAQVESGDESRAFLLLLLLLLLLPHLHFTELAEPLQSWPNFHVGTLSFETAPNICEAGRQLAGLSHSPVA